MLRTMWVLMLSVVGLSTGCASSGALGPNGYTQAQVKYQVTYSDPAKNSFLPEDWALDNYSYDSVKKSWVEKKGNQYRATRYLDEDGDGTISNSETHEENLFDLRFVNTRDNGVIWLKVHPMAFTDSKRDLDVVLENYADGLEGTGLFEQSTLFGTRTINARHFTTFVVEKKPTTIGAVSAIRGTIEVADVDKLRLDSKHRDAKGALVFARIAYLTPAGIYFKEGDWPTVTEPGTGRSMHKRTGLLVIGYWADAARFDSHLPDFEALLSHIVIPPEAVPDNNTRAVVAVPVPEATPAAAPSAPPAPAPETAPSAPAPASPTVPSTPNVSAAPPPASAPPALKSPK